MSRAEPLKQRADYYSIREGSFRLPTTKENPSAIVREWKSPDGSREGVEYELGFKSLYGTITGIRFNENTTKDGKTLKNLNIVLDANEAGIAQIISIPLDSRYTADFLKKLPNITLKDEIRLMPYDFEKDGPRQVGMSIAHKDLDSDTYTIKVENFFIEMTEKDGKKVYNNLHGFPEATEEDREDWQFYFKKVSKFLVSYTKQNIIPKLTGSSFEDTGEDEEGFTKSKVSIKDYKPNSVHYPTAEEEGIDLSDDPF